MCIVVYHYKLHHEIWVASVSKMYPGCRLLEKGLPFLLFSSKAVWLRIEDHRNLFFFCRFLHSNAIKTIESKAFDRLILEQLWVNWKMDWFALKLWKGDKFHELNIFFFLRSAGRQKETTNIFKKKNRSMILGALKIVTCVMSRYFVFQNHLW